ncbi:hypothetical protein EJ110_NYTH52345 [Nymphaea thermarum]|nr:hypothetical protein EJ110_NYTH52345 [Nymphaea thermarum]
MSGGVGSVAGDMRLPDDNEPHASSPANPLESASRKFHILSFRQLNVLAIMIVLGASGMVSPYDLAFFFFSIVYTIVIARIAFPSSVPPVRVFRKGNKLLGAYMAVAALVGLILPIIYIVEGVVDGDQEGMKAAVPHLFLLCAQVLMEGWSYSSQFSTPTQAFVPIFYNTKRVFSIVDWVHAELGKESGDVGSVLRLSIGRGLAFANLALWCFNLFCFLLPVYLPRTMKVYFLGNKEKKGA